MSENVESFDRSSEGGSKKSEEKEGSQKAKAAEKLKEVRDEIERRADRVAQDVRREAARASEFARQRYGEAKEGVRHGYDRYRKDFDQLTEDVNAYVRDNPGRSVLIAAGVGFLVGLLLRGDGRSRGA